MPSSKIDRIDELVANGIEPEFLLSLLNEVSLNQITSGIVLAASELERALISLDTGLQKTSVMCALAMCKHIQSGLSKGSLMIIPTEAWHNVSKIKTWVKPFKVVVLDSLLGLDGRLPSYKQIFFDETPGIIVVSPKLLFSQDFVNMYIAFIRDKIDTVLIDEVHLLANPTTQSGYMLDVLQKQVANLYLLTATPGRNLDQFEYLLGMVDPSGYISLSRRDLDLEGNFHVIMKHTNENDVYPDIVDHLEPNRLHRFRKQVKPSNKIFQDTLQFVLNNAHTGVLLYSRFLQVQAEFAKALTDRGVRVAIINSDTSYQERNRISSLLQAKELDVVVSTVTAAIDIPAKCLVCWGWTSDLVQLVGRTNREYARKDLVLYFNLLDFELEKVEEHLRELVELAVVQLKSPSLFQAIYREVDRC